MKEIEARRGHIDILVNNAGILSGRKPWHELSKDEVSRYVNINYLGYFLVTKAFYPLILKSQTPRVIMVASRTYFLANPGQMAYVASKGAVMGMTRKLCEGNGRAGYSGECRHAADGRDARHGGALTGRSLQSRDGKSGDQEACSTGASLRA